MNIAAYCRVSTDKEDQLVNADFVLTQNADEN